MRYLILSMSLATFLITGCVSASKSKPSHRKSDFVSLYNEGTICVSKIKPDELKITYYPLSTNCVSSSLVNWKLLGFDTKLNKNTLKVESYALFKEQHPQIATTDCAGAGVTTKVIKTPTSNLTLYWGKEKVATITPNTKRACFKKSKNKIEAISIKE